MRTKTCSLSTPLEGKTEAGKAARNMGRIEEKRLKGEKFDLLFLTMLSS
ncbi:hypothetical protein SFC65_14205 [Priestia filamentosa]|nr:hypothetical protein [Priestia filamentosa]